MNDETFVRARLRARLTRRSIRAVLPALLAPLLLAPAATAAVRPAGPSTFSGVFAAAQAGDVIELAAGDYGRFGGSAKPGLVTIRPQAGAAATISPSLSNAANLRFEGLTIPSLDMTGTTRNVAVVGSRFTGFAVVKAEQMSNANIVFDGNTHAGINVCGNCFEGRLQVAGQGPGPSGVTVRNSVFGPGGDADGMQITADGVRVENNEFVGIRQVSAVHSDALQLYGQTNTVVSGNYFHDNDVAIMAPDGGRNEQIVDNVFVGGGSYRAAVQLGSQSNSVFAHNAVRNLDVFLDAKTGGTPSSNSVARDNVFVDGALNMPASKCTGCTATHNLFNRSPTGIATIVAAPLFAGGANPTGYAGYVLAAGSPGKGTASDGTDRGIRLTSGAGAPPAGAGAGAGAAAPTAAPGAVRRVAGARLRAVPRKLRWSRVRRAGVRVTLRVRAPVRVLLRLTRKDNDRLLARSVRRIKAGKRTLVIRADRRGGRQVPRRLALKVLVTNAAGKSSFLQRTIRVKRR